jgi:hypothetical protein
MPGFHKFVIVPFRLNSVTVYTPAGEIKIRPPDKCHNIGFPIGHFVRGVNFGPDAVKYHKVISLAFGIFRADPG